MQSLVACSHTHFMSINGLPVCLLKLLKAWGTFYGVVMLKIESCAQLLGLTYASLEKKERYLSKILLRLIKPLWSFWLGICWTLMSNGLISADRGFSEMVTLKLTTWHLQYSLLWSNTFKWCWITPRGQWAMVKAYIWAKLLLNTYIPPSRSFITWRLIHNKLPTDDNLRKRGCFIVSICCFCMQEAESSQHIFFDCPATYRL